MDVISKGNRAKVMLDDPIFKEAFAKLEADYIAAWKIMPARDTDARERIWLACQVLGKVHEHLITMMNDGKLAQAEIDSIRRAKAA